MVIPVFCVQADAQTVNDIHLTSHDDSKITHVNLYSGRAEITRLFTFPIPAGQNLVIISELPAVLDVQSLRSAQFFYEHIRIGVQSCLKNPRPRKCYHPRRHCSRLLKM